MTEPKHIPLPKRWSDAALERLAAWLITPLEAADDAHDVEAEDREPCAWLVYSNGLTAPSEYCDDYAEQGSPYCTHHTTLLENR